MFSFTHLVMAEQGPPIQVMNQNPQLVRVAAQNVNPAMDPTSPYYLHPNEMPGALMVSPILNGRNYHSWSRSMRMALKAKTKLQFIDGTIAKPNRDDALFPAWDRCNTMVLSWLTHSLCDEIRESVMWRNVAADVWRELKEKYYEGDQFRIAQLQEELFAHKQGEVSVTSYYTKLQSIWEELDDFRPIPECVACGDACVCGLDTVRKYRQADYVVRFLRGLNDSYSGVRSQIMLMEPLPSINKVFSLLSQQERQMYVEEPQPVVSLADSGQGNSFAGRGRGMRGRGRTSSGRGHGGRGSSSKLVCSYCGKTGHLVDTCYKKHGYPLTNKPRGGNVNNVTAEDDLDDNCSVASSHKELREDSCLSFTPEQHKALLALLQQSASSHSTNQITSIPCQPQPYTGIILACPTTKPKSWILDTGATDHVCNSISEFQFLTKIKPVVIKLPNGNQISTNLSVPLCLLITSSLPMCFTFVPFPLTSFLFHDLPTPLTANSIFLLLNVRFRIRIL